MTLKPWKVTDSKWVIKNKWLSLRADTCETPQGSVVPDYYVMECADWAHIIALDDKNNILLTKQYRHGNGKISLEVPCGVIDPGEEPIVAAERELLEETGCVAEIIEGIGVVYPNPARQNNLAYNFIARNVRVVQEPNLDVNEEIDFEFVSLDKLFELIREGEFAHSIHVASVYIALQHAGLLPKSF